MIQDLIQILLLISFHLPLSLYQSSAKNFSTKLFDENGIAVNQEITTSITFDAESNKYIVSFPMV